MDQKQLVLSLAKIREQFIKNLSNTRDDLVRLSSNDILLEPELLQLGSISHKLAGSGATFGFPFLSQAASVLDANQSLKSGRINSQDIQTETHRLILAINQAISSASAEFKPTFGRKPVQSQDQKQVYLLEDDLDFAAYISSELRLDEFKVQLFSSIEEIDQAVKNRPPVAIIADIILPEGENAGIDWVHSINRNMKPPIPVIFISRKGDFNTRLRAVRAGANYYFQKPVSIPQLKDVLHECIHDKPSAPYRILIIDDDALMSQAYKIQLMQHGMLVEVVNDPFKAIDAIESFKPELILLDLYMPGCNGLELGQIIRQWPKYALIPIIFLSVETDSNKQMEAFQLAGDDFIVKPIQPWQLSMKVQARVKHARMASFYTEEMASTLAHRKLHDVLTGLPNKQHLEDYIADTIEKIKATQTEKIFLLWMDVDNFATINDVIGHDAGDLLIIDIGDRIQSQLHRDDFLCRQGGDVFAVVIRRFKNVAKVEALCEHIKDAFRQPFLVNESECCITISIGISAYPDHTDDVHNLIRAADTALHDAKIKGRNTYSVFDNTMSDSLTRQLLLGSKLRQAINRDRGLYLKYQPKYTVDGKKLVGAEALLRWEHDELGSISPAEFIPIAEQSDLIIEVGDWVMRQVCKQIKRWQEKKLPAPKIAINLSSKDFSFPGFVDKLNAITNQYEIDRHYLELELTERTIAHQEIVIIQTLTRLTETGFSIAIDDFGAGYSSLAYLKKLPISLLKIDHSFVKDLPHDADDRGIAETIIKLGQVLSVDVLAEGVETQEQADFLQQRGCQYVQGYLYARPLDCTEFEELLKG